MRKITQFVVDAFIDEFDGEDFDGGFIDGEPYVIEIIDRDNVVVKGKEGMYVVTNIDTERAFIAKLLERVERRIYDDGGEDMVEIVEFE